MLVGLGLGCSGNPKRHQMPDLFERTVMDIDALYPHQSTTSAPYALCMHKCTNVYIYIHL